jgi:RNA polymerase sigma-70 factor, ECF subfamily
MNEAEARAAHVARASYGRLLALLASRSGDIASAEDALADAFRLALEHWPKTGVPENPEAWLMTTAKNRALDGFRRTARSPVVAVDELPEAIDESEEAEDIPDKRLQMMFVCAHPAIDAGLHTALMLQVVLGFEAADIGRSFLVSPAALQQRLVRAKRKIKDARIAFQIPERSDMPERLSAVLESIYGAYSMAWLRDEGARDMTGEALYLSQVIASLLPQEPEVLGLASLLAFIQARQKARASTEAYIPLQQQNPLEWDSVLIASAEKLLVQAARLQNLGRYQLEAAIQHAHMLRIRDGSTDWRAILALSEGLCRLFPTAGSHAERIAALAEVAGPNVALEDLERFQNMLGTPFQPLEALRAHLFSQLQRGAEAKSAYAKAISLTVEPTVRNWLQRQCNLL